MKIKYLIVPELHISIHSLRMEGDLLVSFPAAGKRNFNPLPPHGGRPASVYGRLVRRSFQSTPSAWRETVVSGDPVNVERISIHSLRMEGDLDVMTGYCQQLWISIHSLRMEGDPEVAQSKDSEKLFQSTPSAWRETMTGLGIRIYYPNFNPLPPHGGRPLNFGLGCDVIDISIHSLRMEGDRP